MLQSSLLLAVAFALSACSISPLERKVDVGEEPFVIFVAEGSDGRTDLFASLPGGGELSRFTFTELKEHSPRLTREGGLVAFLRERSPTQTNTFDVVIMNLVSGAERRLQLPDDAGTATSLGWNATETGLYVATNLGERWLLTAPPADPNPVRLPEDQFDTADSAIAVILGTPAFAEAVVCRNGGVCVVGSSGEEQLLSNEGRDPFRWGADSVAWFEGSALFIRSLGPGSPRQISWPNGRVTGMRDGSYATVSHKRQSSPTAGS